MKLLLDTHTLLWHMSNSQNLPNHLHQIIGEPSNQIFISQISLIEISIKLSLGKLTIPGDWQDMLYYFERGGWNILSISNHDVFKLSKLPFLHGDPFDRILACQSINLNMTLVSKDVIFDQYAVSRIWE